MSEETKNTENETVEVNAQGSKTESVEASAGKKPAHKAKGKSGGRNPKKKEESNTNEDGLVVEAEERVVAINRVAKVVKGGRRFSFSALIVVGDKRGNVGFGLGKAKEVPDAIRKGVQKAHKNMLRVPVEGGTIPHETLGEFDAGKIIFKPAGEGTGIKAAGACRTILELAGIENVITKSVRGNNPHNVVKATFAALKQLRSVEQVARDRGIEAKGLRIK